MDRQLGGGEVDPTDNTPPTAPGTPVASNVAATGATLTGLRSNTAYRLAVQARNGAGLTSALSGAVPVTTEPDGQTYCEITYRATGWSTGLYASITNTSGVDWGSWTLGFTGPGNQRITEGWSATWTQTGTAVSAASTSWNSRVPAGGSVQAGFNASSAPPHPEPTDFAVNGQPCSKGLTRGVRSCLLEHGGQPLSGADAHCQDGRKPGMIRLTHPDR